VVRPARLPGAVRVLVGAEEAVFFRGRDDVAVDGRPLAGAFRVAAVGRAGAGPSGCGAMASATDSRTRPTAAAAEVRLAAACLTAAARSAVSYMPPTVAVSTEDLRQTLQRYRELSCTLLRS
jgi:hypothetical protein